METEIREDEPASILDTAQKFAQGQTDQDGIVTLDDFDFVSLEDDSENDLIPSSSDADDTEGEVSILDTAQKFAQMMNPEYASEQEDFDHE